MKSLIIALITVAGLIIGADWYWNDLRFVKSILGKSVIVEGETTKTFDFKKLEGYLSFTLLAGEGEYEQTTPYNQVNWFSNCKGNAKHWVYTVVHVIHEFNLNNVQTFGIDTLNKVYYMNVTKKNITEKIIRIDSLSIDTLIGPPCILEEIDAQKVLAQTNQAKTEAEMRARDAIDMDNLSEQSAAHLNRIINLLLQEGYRRIEKPRMDFETIVGTPPYISIPSSAIVPK